MLNNLLLLIFVACNFSLHAQNINTAHNNSWHQEHPSPISSSVNQVFTQYQFKKNIAENNDEKFLNQNSISSLKAQLTNKKAWKSSLITISSICICLILFYLFKRVNYFRNLQLQKDREDFKLKLSNELHDQVGSILTGIAMESEYLSLQAKNIPVENVKDISNRSRDAMEKMRDIIWSLDSRKNQYENLLTKMKDFADASFENSKFNYKFRSTDNLDKALIEHDIKKSVYYIFRESIVNILKHSKGNHVQIEFFKLDRELVLKVKDNGLFEPKKFNTGQGLSNMIMRVKERGGQIIFDTKDGFEVIVIIPLKLRKMWSSN